MMSCQYHVNCDLGEWVDTVFVSFSKLTMFHYKQGRHSGAVQRYAARGGLGAHGTDDGGHIPYQCTIIRLLSLLLTFRPEFTETDACGADGCAGSNDSDGHLLRRLELEHHAAVLPSGPDGGRL